MNSFRLEDPIWLLMLVPVLGALWIQSRKRRRSTVIFSSVSLLRDLPRTFAQRLRSVLPALRFIGLSLLVISLARPQEGREEYRIRTEGVSILMCIDRSGSMRAMDFEHDGERVNRLEVVKRVFHDFVEGEGSLEGRPDDLIGLIVFGGFAESRCPLTLDHGTLLKILDGVEFPVPLRDRFGQVIDREFQDQELATAIGDALARSVDRLKNSESKSRVVILLSDGENTAGVVDPRQAAEAAKALGIKVYTIGVGSTGLAPFPQTDAFGRTRLVSQPVRLDEELLTSIAETTGGEYFNVRNTSSLEDVYARIDELEKTEVESLLYTEYRELFPYALLPGAILLILDLLLRATRFAALP